VKAKELKYIADGTHELLQSWADSVKVQRSNMIIRLLAQIALNTMPVTIVDFAEALVASKTGEIEQ